MMPRTAIVTRTKNRPVLLERALQSVLAQTDSDWIHVIVNDGGDRREVDALVERHRDRYAGRARVMHHSHSLGMEAASNAGIASCDSEFLLIHDDDDSLEPTYLEEACGFLRNSDPSVFGGVVCLTNQVLERMTESGAVVEVGRELHRPLAHCIHIDEMARINQFPPIAFLFRRSVYGKVGGFDESLPVLGDWDFHLRCLFESDIGVLAARLANYHLRPASQDPAAANSLHAGKEKHAMYDSLLRNRYVRSEKYAALGLLMQLHGSADGPRQRLQRLYRHPVIGGAIRAWSRFVNPSIPYNAD